MKDATPTSYHLPGGSLEQEPLPTADPHLLPPLRPALILHPGDIVVIELSRPASAADLDRIRQSIEQLDIKAIILEPGMTITREGNPT